MALPAASRCVLTAALLVVAFAVHANRYTIIDLGEFKDVGGVNHDRYVAGNGTGAKGGAAEWRNGTWHKIGPHSTQATGINGRGDLSGINIAVPWIWPRGEASHVVDLPGPGVARTAAIAQDRTIAGYFLDSDGWADHCYMTLEDGTSTDLGFMEDGDFCHAFSINGGHQVAGAGAVTFGGYAHAFLWQDGVFTPLGLLQGGDSSQANSVNYGGDAVGESDMTGGQSHAVLWSQGATIDIGDDPAYRYTGAAAINDSGEIVGSGETADGLSQKALRFADGQVVDLAAEVDNLDDWQLWYALAINNDGVIVGQGSRAYVHGRKPHRREHAFMLVPADARE